MAFMMHLMTTTNPRLTITLQPSVSAQIRELSRLTGSSQSGVISELLESSSPIFERLIQVLAAAETAKAELGGQVKRDLEAAQTRVERQLGLILEDFGDVTRPILSTAESITRRATPGRARSGTSGARRRDATPLSNRGVRYDQSTIKPIANKKDSLRPKAKKHGGKSGGVV
jgi:hypothetical protein